MTALNRDTFIYDGDCGLCEQAVAWLEPRGDGTVEFVAATPDLLQRLDVEADAARDAAILITTSGRRYVGSLAFGEVLRRSDKYDRRLAGRLLLEQPSRQVAGWAYAWVAKNRHRISGRGGRVCGTDR